METRALQGFRSVRGHAAPIALLRRALLHGRVASAYLFAGPQGVGKDLVAHALAQTANCLAGPEACGACDRCRRIAAGIFVDLVVVQRELRDTATAKDREESADARHEDLDAKKLRQEIVVEQVDEVLKRLAFRPHEQGTRWILVREADRMNASAANKLLKTLEEPPTDTHFVLLSHRPSALLPTIRSRCQTVNFGPLDDADVSDVLRGLGLDDAHVRDLLPLAEGSVGRALVYKDPTRLAARKKLLDEMLAALRTPGVVVGSFADLGIRFKDPPEKPGQFGKTELDETLLLLLRHLRSESLAAVRAGAAPRQAVVNAVRADIVRETLELLDGATAFNAGVHLQAMLVRLREARA